MTATVAPSTGVMLELRWRIGGSFNRASESKYCSIAEVCFRVLTQPSGSWVECVIGQDRRRVAARLEQDDDLLHVEAAGLLKATFRAGAVLYATTPVLYEFGVPGGRYSVESRIV